MVDIKLSCIIINNHTPGLLQVLESVLKQSYENLECLVVNASSCDEQGVSELLKKDIFITIDYDFQDENLLISKAIEKCSGDFITILTNNRHFYSSETISNLLVDISAADDIIYGDMVKVYPDGACEISLYPSIITFEDLLYKYLDIIPVAIIRKELFNKFEFYCKNLPLTGKMFFIIKVAVLNLLSVKHKDILVVYQTVNRGGGLIKLSDAHLLSKERDKLIQTFFSESLKTFLYDKVVLDNYVKNARVMSIVRPLEKIKVSIAQSVGPLLKKIKYSFQSIVSNIQLRSYKARYGAESFNIPIIINNRNHLSYLQRLISSLEKRGYTNIFIIDNDSSYQPLEDYYNSIPYKVFKLNDNIGFCALWDTDLYDAFKDNYYVYTDSDMELVDECPNDFLVVIRYLLDKYSVGKVGLSLLTNDLPEYYVNKQEVISWEGQFQKQVIEELACRAQVDTTFALYGPGSFGHAGMLTSLRSRFPYSARHLPWYENTQELSEEQRYYYSNVKTSSHWSSKIQEVDDAVS